MKTILILLLLVLTGFSTQAQNNFQFVANYDYSTNSFFNGVDFTGIDPDTYGMMNMNFVLDSTISTITLNLSSSTSLTFTVNDSYEDKTGTLLWYGSSTSGTCLNCSLELKSLDNIVEGQLVRGSVYTGISHISGSEYFFYEKADHNGDCDSDHEIHTEGDPASNAARFFPVDWVKATCGGIQTFGLIMAYTPQFAANVTVDTTNGETRQEAIHNRIQRIQDSINVSYQRSNVDIRVRIVYSYQTPENEYGNKDSDFDAFTKKKRRNIFTGTEFERYDEIWKYMTEYNADAAILLTRNGDGGRADREKNMGVYMGLLNQALFGVAHEIGHMFNLDHNREEYNWAERIFLDGKGAYGYRDDGFRTVMSYPSGVRVGLYSDPGLEFPNGTAAGDGKAKARNYMRNNLHRVLQKFDYYNYEVSDVTITPSERVGRFAINDIETENTIVQNEARLNLSSGNSVKLLAGTQFMAGSRVKITVVTCEDSYASREGGTAGRKVQQMSAAEDISEKAIATGSSELQIFPNPAEDLITIAYQSDQKTNISLQVYNTSGSLVLSKDYRDTSQLNTRLDISSLEQGLYLVNLCDSSGNCQSSRLLVK